MEEEVQFLSKEGAEWHLRKPDPNQLYGLNCDCVFLVGLLQNYLESLEHELIAFQKELKDFKWKKFKEDESDYINEKVYPWLNPMDIQKKMIWFQDIVNFPSVMRLTIDQDESSGGSI